ncbi:uncharacterized protein PSANT_06029 [Moesziomyces antarcticus]|uniref:Uncharacterized protein n=1 Tax=Pseudozyma antarctica TaxID=84753 RepID=A0A5C3FVW1_PSEA2|nr:uncharacterized protein PSANT_06029 [Moesziomyces antarcticus]
MARLRRQQRLRAREPGAEAAAVLESRVSKPFGAPICPANLRHGFGHGRAQDRSTRHGGAGRGGGDVTSQHSYAAAGGLRRNGLADGPKK